MAPPLRDQSAKALKCRAIELLATGVVPFEQWAHVFANPQLRDWDGLRSKAFSVWFSTMSDFLKGQEEWQALNAELDRRRESYADVFERLSELANHYKRILGMYSEEDQIFLRDRRLQNVHGRLHIYERDEHEIPVFDPVTGSVVKVDKTAAEYRDIMHRYYPRLREATRELLERLLASPVFSQFTSYYESKLRVGPRLAPLIEALGVGAACGSE